MEKRLLLAAGLSLGVLLVWEFAVPKPAPVKTPGRPAVTAAAIPAADVTPAESAQTPPSGEKISATAEQTAVLENGLVRATFSNRGGGVTSLVLLRQRDDQNRPLELVRSLPASAPRPLTLDFPGRPDLTRRIHEALFTLEKMGERAVRMRYSDASVSVTKEIALSSGYLFDVSVVVGGPAYTLLAAAGLRNPTEKELGSRYVIPATAVVSAARGLERFRPDKVEKPLAAPLPERGFAGLEDNYFLAAVIPKGSQTARVIPVPLPDAGGKPQRTLAVGVDGHGVLAAQAYYGPKDVEILEGLKLGLERTVDFGWFGILARPLLWLLKKTYGIVRNWGVGILLVTLLIRILLFPLMHKSYASMKKMQKLAPKMNAIRDKYKKAKTDAAQRAKMNQELMALYQAEGYNPMSGCFPMLLQLPILVAFYNVLSRAVELRHAPFVLWIHDLSAVDRTFVLLILMIVTMYVQQAMTPSTADPAQKRIFMAMPLIWGFFLKDMPSGLVLYWLFSNVLTILQQMLINRMGREDEPSAVTAKVEGRRAKPPGTPKPKKVTGMRR